MTNSPAYKDNAQIATIASNSHTGKIASNRKEKHFYAQSSLIAIDSGRVREIAVARFYATKSRHYCCVWVYHPSMYVAGGGNASGYGYHRASAAFETACDNAGIAFKQAIGGAGDSAVESGLKAIGIALGYEYEQLCIIQAHG